MALLEIIPSVILYIGLTIVITLFILYLVNRYFPVGWRTVTNVIIIVIVIFILLYILGVHF